MTTPPEPVTISSNELHRATGQWLDQARDHPVIVTRYGRQLAVVISPELYEQLLNGARKKTT